MIQINQRLALYVYYMYKKSTRTPNKVQSSSFVTRPSIPNQSRIKERLSCSPLKIPLQHAIHKATLIHDSKQKYCSNSRLTKSKVKDQNRNLSPNWNISKNMHQYQPLYFKDKIHQQTNNFINKYFYSVEFVNIQQFVQCVMKEYEHLWGIQNSDKVLQDFYQKIFDIFGQNIRIGQLIKRTSNDGMIGLILQIFKIIKNEQKQKPCISIPIYNNSSLQVLSKSLQKQLIINQNISNVKNVIQEFMETMYKCMQNQIYNKFNVQMRRMILKYRQTQKLIKNINNKINMYNDIFDYDIKLNKQKKQYQLIITNLNKQKQQMSKQLQRQKNNLQIQKRINNKLIQDNKKLTINLQKFENVILNKIMETNNSFIDQKKISSILPINDQNAIPQNKQPFHIVIDTQIIQKNGQPPETQTQATLYNLGSFMNQSRAPLTPLQYPSNTQSRFIQPYSTYDHS